MWWTRAERRRRRGNALVCMAPMSRTESTRPYSMVSGSSSAPTGPQPRGRPRPAHRHRHRLRAAWARPRACRRPDPRDRGVDVAPAGRDGDVEGAVAVELDLSQLRLPVPGEQRASRQQNRRGGALARADGQRKWRRAEAGAESTESGRHGSGHRARVRPRARAPAACACSMCTGLARAAAGPAEAAPHAWRGAHLWMVGWYPWALKRLVLVTK